MRIYQLVVILIVTTVSATFGQSYDCTISISGKVVDDHDGEILEYANVYIPEIGVGAVVDSNGLFEINGLCKGGIHLEISHVGCELKRLPLFLERDTFINVMLEHHSEYLKEIMVKGQASNGQLVQNKTVISRNEIAESAGQALAEMTRTIAGVNSLKNGSGISKPVIHGLFGNRVTILNNGIAQAGQQWGNDHAPEIDPNVAKEIVVIKGASAVQYGSQALGGVVMVNPGAIGNDPHIHGNVLYAYGSNGRAHSISARLEQANPFLKWRLVTSFKKSGDRTAPDYFLTNTGNEEKSVAVQLSKEHSDKWTSELYYSFFQTDLGVLRGSHIGNFTDLSAAIGREKPFFTRDTFSYAIAAPRQSVNHHLLKLQSKYFIADNKYFNFSYGGQLNQRSEYDVRRVGRSDIPALSLDMLSHIIDLSYFSEQNSRQLIAGIQSNYQNNTNSADIDFLPLIPNFKSLTLSPYIILKNYGDSFNWETGLRYDHRQLRVRKISNTLPRIIERKEHNFRNISLSLGGEYILSNQLRTKMNWVFAERSPEVNELYSAGLHQGVSGIEEGKESLIPEKSLKGIWTNTLAFGDHFWLESSLYYQWIKDFIFLNPQQDFRLTIRGAFPLFTYEQTDATIGGMDLIIKTEPNAHLNGSLKYSIVRGRDISNDQALIFMPADQISSRWSYSLKNQKVIKNSIVSIEGLYTFKQTRFNADQDFLSPPDAYFLLSLSWSSDVKIAKKSFHFSVIADNLLNTKYRDYLNRLRYYADEEGRNIRMVVALNF